MKKILEISLLFLLFTPVAFGASAHCDFNNDGFDDLAIGVSNEDTGTALEDFNIGRVHVIYGSETGLNSAGSQLWHRDSAGILGEPGDLFGFALACGDFDGNDFSDLAIGSLDDSINVLYGSSAGLSATGNQLWNQDSPGVLDTMEAGDGFGQALASGDFNGDGYSDLAVGVPGEELLNDFEHSTAGAVHILYGSSIGLTSANNQFWTQNSPGVANFMEINDRFGSALAAGNFGKDGTGCYDDLAIGVYESWGYLNQEEQLYTTHAAGAVNVLYGSNTGLSSSGNQFYHQDLPDIPGINEPEEHFGSVLAAGVFGGVTTACGALSDLVIGIPRARLSDQYSASGAVLVLYATVNGLSTTGSQFIHQDSPGMPDSTEGQDLFGKALATGRTTSGRDYLAIGVPEEGLNVADTGIVDVLYADPASGKLTTVGMKHYSQNTAGVPDSNEANDLFGSSLFAGNFNGFGDDDLAIGTPSEGFNTIIAAGAVTILFGANTNTTQLWNQNSPGIADFMEFADLFGSELP